MAVAAGLPHPLERFAPDPEDTALFAGRVRFSADWQALVLRDGTAFVGLSADPGGDQTFHATAAHHVHTIYLDVFLLVSSSTSVPTPSRTRSPRSPRARPTCTGCCDSKAA